MSTLKKYWKGLEELEQNPEFIKNVHREFPDYLPVLGKDENNHTPRRDFLKLMGFSIAAASLAACETPVKKIIPYVNKPEDVEPGIANWYSGTYYQGTDYASILVKTREGRPIKVEGNKFSSITRGGTSVRTQASVLSLYDKQRLTSPKFSGEDITWEDADREIINRLNEISQKNGQIRLVTSTIISPSTLELINDFKEKFPNTKHIVYDSISYYGIRKANEISFGKSVIPFYHFDKADIIVSLDADFLGTWLMPTTYINQYTQRRKLNKSQKSISRHYQFETNLTLTGSNADHRIPIKPSQLGLLALTLYKAIGGNEDVQTGEFKFIKEIASDLLQAKGRSIVICGSNDPYVQVVVNAINDLLGNIGRTINLSNYVTLAQGNDEEFNNFVNELKDGSIDAVLFYNTNPLYTHYRSNEIREGLSKSNLTISFSPILDETASYVKYVLPDNHLFESWNDYEPVKGFYSFNQPTISPLFNTRQFQNSLLKFLNSDKDYYTYIREKWYNIFKTQFEYNNFNDFWNRCIHNGVYETEFVEQKFTFKGNIKEAENAIRSTYKPSDGLEVKLYQKIGIGDGSEANNPWLQEFPDPISKATWDNYIAIPKRLADQYGLKNFQGFTVYGILKINNSSIKLPILIQPGQANDTVSVALGYGRTRAGKVGNNVGVNVFPYVTVLNNIPQYFATNATLEFTTESYQIAQTQTHQTLMGRNIVQEVQTLKAYLEEPNIRKHNEKFEKTIVTSNGEKRADELSIWSAAEWEKKRTNHFWGLVIDLNSCVGCGACVISCQAENNVPVVGRDEVANSRDMHWIRIDRYYSSDATEDYKAMEEPSENPQVVFQPIMCQHCNNAPCETVCPVLATTHSTEGLNQMTYNRCVGTRYCANNCPYKVRRFNWFAYYENDRFDYHMNNDLGKMVLNPDVTVRARGVMEKCSMCIQRIQEGKLLAKKERRRPIDGEIETACSQSCPGEAIVFGDMNDPESRISKLINEEKEGRLYQVLEEINTRPSVYYLSKVRNLLA